MRRAAILLYLHIGGGIIGLLMGLSGDRMTGAARIARHLWRMCFSLFIASGSLFLGQPQVFPDWFNATPLPLLFAFLPLVAIAVWWPLVRFRRRRAQA